MEADDKIFGDLQVDNVTRKKIYENISKPVYKDPKTGEFLTAIQKYEKDNKEILTKSLQLEKTFYTLKLKIQLIISFCLVIIST